MKIENLPFVIIVILFFQGCNSQTKNVELYLAYSPKKEGIVHEKKTNNPYTGKFISKSNVDKVEIDFKNGKMDGIYLRTFLNGDTIKYSKYSDGVEISRLDFIYDHRELDYKELIKNKPGSSSDIQLFVKTCNFIINKRFDELENFLNNDYEESFKKYELLFGPLNDYGIKKVQKKYYRYNKSEHIVGTINFKFEKKDIEVTYEIVKTPSEISGQAFNFPVLDFEFDNGEYVDKIIHTINNKNSNEFIALTMYTPENKEQVTKFLKQIGEISNEYKFLNSYFTFYNELLIVQDYLIEVKKEKIVMSLIFQIKGINQFQLLNIDLYPYMREFNVPHRVN